MKQDFSELFEIIWNKFIPNRGERKSLPTLASFLGHEHKGKVTAWSKGQWPSAYDCWIIHSKMDFCLEWLLTGEGEPFGNDGPVSLDTGGIPAIEVTALQTKITELEAELAEERRLNRQLVTRLMKDC